MRLDALLQELEPHTLHGDATGVDVVSATHDSRAVRAGSLFCCVPGLRTDGHRHAPQAVAAGATALLCERVLDLDVPQVVVDDVRRRMGAAAAAIHGHPSRTLQVVGITGTNGKTTTTAMLASIMEAAGRPTGVMGTLSGQRTTPEATELQERLASFRDEGRTAVVMEVSSHALALCRVEGTWFSAAVFTNLSRDHLEFHETMEDYFAAKARLFEPERTAVAVVNADDPHGRLLLDAARVPTLGFSLAELSDVDVGVARSAATWRGRRIEVPLGGRVNLANALAAATTAVALGVDEDAVVAGLAALPPVRGRYEVVDVGQPFTVVVDYAHTPDGLEQLLRSVRPAVGDGRVLLVFGCGGERDATKRPHMGEVAARLADLAVITSDNPRGEDPEAIIAAVRAGVDGGSRARVEVEPDRRAAIARALAAAEPGDAVLLAGKGHETTQVIAGRELPFDDRVVAAEELARLGHARAS